jgi:hypothetical protein
VNLEQRAPQPHSLRLMQPSLGKSHDLRHCLKLGAGGAARKPG